MTYEHNPKSTARIAGHPIHPMLIPFPIAFFVSTFVVDLMFWRTGDVGWVTASEWLLGAGLVMAALAAVAGLTDFIGSPEVRRLGAASQHMIGNVAAVLIELFNLVIRLNNGPGAVMPWGLLSSTVVVAILLFTGWKGWEMVYRNHVGVSDEPTRPA
jgi:uncharacterized membrane protein